MVSGSTGLLHAATRERRQHPMLWCSLFAECQFLFLFTLSVIPKIQKLRNQYFCQLLHQGLGSFDSCRLWADSHLPQGPASPTAGRTQGHAHPCLPSLLHCRDWRSQPGNQPTWETAPEQHCPHATELSMGASHHWTQPQACAFGGCPSPCADGRTMTDQTGSPKSR